MEKLRDGNEVRGKVGIEVDGRGAIESFVDGNVVGFPVGLWFNVGDKVRCGFGDVARCGLGAAVVGWVVFKSGGNKMLSTM